MGIVCMLVRLYASIKQVCTSPIVFIPSVLLQNIQYGYSVLNGYWAGCIYSVWQLLNWIPAPHVHIVLPTMV